MSGMVIDGELAAPDPVVWTCPRPGCTRRTVEDSGEHFRRAYCTGDPVTGRPHALAPMERTPSFVEEAARMLDVQLTPWQLDVGRRVMSLDDLGRMPRELPPGICGTCGPMVEVDNPMRREIRHRRGCPSA